MNEALMIEVRERVLMVETISQDIESTSKKGF